MIYHHDVTNSEVSEIQTWALYSRKIITFQNKILKRMTLKNVTSVESLSQNLSENFI